MKKTIISLFSMMAILIGIVVLPACNSETDKPEYRALIITGQNNHAWPVSTPILEQILENSGIFQVDVAKTAEKGGDMSNFTPNFSNYDVVVLDYSGDSWPEETNTSFLEYVSGGGGVVVYHAANNAFREWKEYNKIIGLGGWGNRDESDGPYLRWRDGEVVRIDEPGPGGSHGAQHAFRVIMRDTEHPITKGLPEQWMHAQDELYQHLRGPAENLTVLATAFADSSKGGTHEHEPALMTITYGDGRIFHTTLGHVNGSGSSPAMECVGFIVTLQRGAEWAASGEVTQEIPDDFPRFNVRSSWPEFRPINLDEALLKLKDYHHGDSRMAAQDLSNLIRKQYGTDEFKTTEDKLLSFLQSKASNDAKDYICRELSMVGSDKALPVLEKLMKDEDLSEIARFAYERISGEYSN